MKQRVLPWAKLSVCLLLLLFFTPAAQPRLTPPWPQPHLSAFDHPGVAIQGSPEAMIVAAIDAVREGRMADARATIDALLAKAPNYRLAHLVSADLYAMRAAPLADLGGGVASAPQDRLDDLKREAQVRLLRHTAPPPVGHLPAQLLALSPAQRHAVLVDTGSARAYLFENDKGVPRYVTDYYVTIGKLGIDKLKEGDQRTPLGVYFVTGHMPRLQLDRIYGEAAELYGVGAWPISYPNELDRREGRTGHGIWLHGVPYDTYARAPQASNGCVALTNEDMAALARWLQPGTTPVVNVTQVDWLPPHAWRQRREAALARIEAWRAAAETAEPARLQAFYGSQFSTEESRPARGGTVRPQAIALENISLFATAGERPQWVATFDQQSRSERTQIRQRKRVYWQQEGTDWKILWEGRARAG
ncbi:L,D-transpeptidase [Chitiniphilus purpureus]|uniref:L,D-transpeptidase n=1 Tax=Chitiniphilus purpureus TaxID=2981137 RepID=A0ABY6DRN3_9NEIS|nr:L,D-transpeptidase [Chitiniphilus sp. CD1]UXY17035.1 L,D-transpeptidase [Chitiniphilus sp. CD1]